MLIKEEKKKYARTHTHIHMHTRTRTYTCLQNSIKINEFCKWKKSQQNGNLPAKYFLPFSF